MLLGQNGGRGQESCLFAVHDTFENSSEGHLGLAKADIAAKQPVHDFFRFHVALDFRNAGHLVRRFIVGEILFELLLPHRIRTEGKTAVGGTFGIEPDQIRGQFLDRFPGTFFLAGPLLAAKFR